MNLVAEPFDLKSMWDLLSFRYVPAHYFCEKTPDASWGFNEELFSKKYIAEYAYKFPTVFKKFKLIFDDPLRHGVSINYNITEINEDYVLCNPVILDKKRTGYIKEMLQRLEINNGILVCCGDDANLSTVLHHLTELKPFFKKIYYEAKDIECDFVQTIPMGLWTAYTLRCGGDDIILPHIKKRKNKVKLIGAAKSSRWLFLERRIPERKRLRLLQQRRAKFIDDISCSPLVWYERLSDYKFFVSPVGGGVQTPKLFESILCETIPIVCNNVAHRELRDIYGFPLLIVDNWTDINLDWLNQQWESVYSKINWDEQKNKLLVENFYNLLV